MKHRSIRAVAELSIYVALAFIFGYLENLFPIPMPVPGMKLGFANVITVIVLYRRNFRDALLVSLLRIILNAFTFGSLFSLLYSLAGSLLSLFIMTLIKRKTSPGPGQCQCCRRYLPQPGTIYNRWSFGGFPGTDLLCPSSLFCRSYFWYFDWDPVQLCLESCPIIDYNRCQK